VAQNDLIADALTRIRNAVQAGQDRVTLPCSRTLNEIMRILKEEGYITNFRMVQDSGPLTQIRVQLKISSNKKQPTIRSLQRVSRCSNRVYRGYRKLPRVLRGMGFAIVSTPKGIMTDKKAKQLKVGGEILCKVY